MSCASVLGVHDARRSLHAEWRRWRLPPCRTEFVHRDTFKLDESRERSA